VTESRFADVIPLRSPERPGAGDLADTLWNMADEVGVTLAQLVAVADENGVSLPEGVRSAAAALASGVVAGDAGVGTQISDTMREDLVNRMEFIKGMLFMAGGPALRRLGGIRQVRLGAGDVERFRTSLTRLYQLDDHYGGSDSVYELTTRTVRQMRSVMDAATYDPATGRQLLTIAGEVAEHAGWLAYDARRHAEARYWWLEAQHASAMAGDNAAMTVVLASMSLQASEQHRGQAAVDMASAALRASRVQMTPRLKSVLLARESLGHAINGDRSRTFQCLRRSAAGIDQHRDTDPAWIEFWGTADLAWHRALAATALSDLDMAESAANEAVAANDAAAYARNHALYESLLASVLVDQDKVDQALPMLASVASTVSHVASTRVTDQLKSTLHALLPRRRHRPVADLFDWLSVTAPELAATL
jgi:hypothetical protein